MSRFVFLDRDGTLVRDLGYTHRVEDYELLPGVVTGLCRLLGSGYRLAVITNQSGIGRGYYSEAQYAAFQAHLVSDLAGQGITIEASYVCPHHPDDGCECRKPRPALLHRARDELCARSETAPSTWSWRSTAAAGERCSSGPAAAQPRPRCRRRSRGRRASRRP